MKIIDGHQLLEKLGEGGFAEVWKARYEGNLCAVKIFKNPDQVRQLQRESLAQWSLSSKDHKEASKFAAIEQVQLQHNPPYLRMELVEGEDLSQWEKPRPPFLTFLLARTILQALVYAHERGYVHGDLSPANIIVQDWNEDRCDIKLIDTGFGRAILEDLTDLELSLELSHHQKSMAGGVAKYRYYPPERFTEKYLDNDRLRQSCDLYGLGKIILECLTGSPEAQVNVVQESGLINRYLAKWLSRLVHYDWSQRYHRADEALHDLDQIWYKSPWTRPRDSDRISKWEAKNPSTSSNSTWVSSLTLVNLSIPAIIFLLIAMWIASSSKPPKKAKPPSPFDGYTHRPYKPMGNDPSYDTHQYDGKSPHLPSKITFHSKAKIPLSTNVNKIVFSRDENKIFVAMLKNRIDVYSVSSGKKLESFSMVSQNISLSRDGRYLAGFDGGMFQIINLKNNTVITRLADRQGSWRASAISPNSRYFALVDDNGQVNCWETASGSLVARGKTRHKVTAAAFSHNEKVLLLGTKRGRVYIWSLREKWKWKRETYSPPARFFGSGAVRDMKFSPRGGFFYILYDEEVKPHRKKASTGEWLIGKKFPNSKAKSLAFWNDGKYMVYHEKPGVFRLVEGGSWHWRQYNLGFGSDVIPIFGSRGHFLAAFYLSAAECRIYSIKR